MIDAALTYVRDLLNEHFKNEFSVSENKVVLSNIIKNNGEVAPNLDGKIVFFLISLNEEPALRNSVNRSAAVKNGNMAVKTSALNLNLQMLFCSNFDSNVYTEGLSYLTSLVKFFKTNKIIPLQLNSNKPGKLSFEMCSLNYDELSHLWSAIGSKLLPSVIYKVSMIVIDDMPVRKVIPAIKQTEGNG
jgi:hypothetical protein